MQTCTCGHCSGCRARQEVLAFARSIDWQDFWWLPSSKIIGTEPGWNLFVSTHEEEELRWVLKKAREQGLLQEHPQERPRLWLVE